jgi:hypothetical protein
MNNKRKMKKKTKKTSGRALSPELKPYHCQKKKEREKYVYCCVSFTTRLR